jgi:hypothetical protein
MTTIETKPEWDIAKITGHLMAIVDSRLQALMYAEKRMEEALDLRYIMEEFASSEYFTPALIIEVDAIASERVCVQGFSPDDEKLAAALKPHPQFVELTGGPGYSGGGLQSKNEWVPIIYGIVYAELVKLGFTVVGSHESYF